MGVFNYIIPLKWKYSRPWSEIRFVATVIENKFGNTRGRVLNYASEGKFQMEGTLSEIYRWLEIY